MEFKPAPEHAAYLLRLKERLTEPFSHVHAAGHDVHHVRRMERMGPRIAGITDIPGFVIDPSEYIAMVWLHNLDRIPAIMPTIRNLGLYSTALYYLVDSNFSAERQHVLAVAAATHNKLHDEPGDDPILTAVRIADKIDRMGPIGCLTAAMFHGYELPIYGPNGELEFATTVEGRKKMVYEDFFRILEWVDLLPSDGARDLIDPASLRALIDFVRALGYEVATRFDMPNDVEGDIRRALGRHYERFAL